MKPIKRFNPLFVNNLNLANWLIIILIFFPFLRIHSQKNIDQNERLHLLHKSMGVKSSILIYNQKKNKYITNDTSLINQLITPNNTFYILESLIGLESGNIKDTADFFTWDQQNYSNPNWNQDQNLTMALKFQTEWYFNQVAQKIDTAKMKSWINLVDYGNKDLSGGVTQCWKNNSLKITVKQQMDLLRKMYYYNLPFSVEHLRYIRKTFSFSRLNNKNLYSFKTKGLNNNLPVIWYLGYVEFLNNTYLVVHTVEMTSRKKNKYFSTIQSELLFSTLKDLGVMDDGMCGKM
jgi:beta-lactamase class D